MSIFVKKNTELIAFAKLCRSRRCVRGRTCGSRYRTLAICPRIPEARWFWFARGIDREYPRDGTIM